MPERRSVAELIVLAFTAIIGVTVLGLGATLAVIEVRDPETDTSVGVAVFMNLVSTILGALFGLLARGSRR